MQRSSNFHENLNRNEKVQLGSNKKFGLVMALFFLLLALYPILKEEAPKYSLLAISFIFLILSLLRPQLLYYPNWLWMQLGRVLGMVVAPLILAILFFLIFTPIGLLLRIFGKDLLNMRLNKTVPTFWIGSTATNQNFKDQF